MKRAALLLLLLTPGALSAGTAQDIRADAQLALSGAPCSTHTDVVELGGGDPVKCLMHQEEQLRLRRIHWRRIITTF